MIMKAALTIVLPSKAEWREDKPCNITLMIQYEHFRDSRHPARFPAITDSWSVINNSFGKNLISGLGEYRFNKIKQKTSAFLSHDAET